MAGDARREHGAAAGGAEGGKEGGEGRSLRRSGEGSRHRREAQPLPPPRLPAGLRPRCRRLGQTCLPLPSIPAAILRGTTSRWRGRPLSPPCCVPRVNTEGEGGLHFFLFFFLSRQPVNRLPPLPSRASAPSPVSQPGSAQEPLLPASAEAGTPLNVGFAFCLFLSLPAIRTRFQRCPLPPLSSAATQQHDTGGEQLAARCLL